jgi:hypothetical protein
METYVHLKNTEIELLLEALDFYRTKAISFSNNLTNSFAEEIKELKFKIENQTDVKTESCMC